MNEIVKQCNVISCAILTCSALP